MLKIFSNPFTKVLSQKALISQEAMREFDAEHFNSKTLKELFTDKKFKSPDADYVFVKSRKTGEPVKIKVNSEMIDDGGIVTYEYRFFAPYHLFCGNKDFGITKSDKKMVIGHMQTYPLDFIGLGIREDEIQIKTALQEGIDSIPRISYPEAILYHVKMGFRPTEHLERLWSHSHLKLELQEMLEDNPGLEKGLVTPIIKEKKCLFGKKFYLDKNATIALANLRTVKKMLMEENFVFKRVNRFLSENVELVLEGKNLEYWKDLIRGKLYK